MKDLFVYGSLQFPQVLEIVLGYIPAMQIVQAPGWKACRLQGESYPGLVPDPDSNAAGMLLMDLDDTTFAALDNFEGAQYQRQMIEVHTVMDHTRMAYAYILADDSALESVWTKNQLSGQVLDDFLQYCVEWRAEYKS